MGTCHQHLGLGGGVVNIRALAVSGSSVYIAGGFSGPSATFGSITLPNISGLTPYVAKLPDAGSFVWAIGGSTPEFVEARALAVSGSSVYLAGNFNGPALVLGSTILASTGNQDTYVTKLTDAGSTASLAWAQRAGATSTAGQVVATALATNGPSVYLTQPTLHALSTLCCQALQLGAAPAQALAFALQAAGRGNGS